MTVRTALIGSDVIAPIHPRAAELPDSGIAYIGAFDTDATRAAGIDDLVLQDGTIDIAFGGVPQDFARAIEEDMEPAVSAVDGLRAVEIIEAAARAARHRRIVDPLNNP